MEARWHQMNVIKNSTKMRELKGLLKSYSNGIFTKDEMKSHLLDSMSYLVESFLDEILDDIKSGKISYEDAAKKLYY